MESLAIKTEEQIAIEIIGKHLPEMIFNLVDGHGTTMVNLWAKNKVKHIFQKRKDSDKPYRKTYRVRRKDGTWQDIEVY